MLMLGLVTEIYKHFLFTRQPEVYAPGSLLLGGGSGAVGGDPTGHMLRRPNSFLQPPNHTRAFASQAGWMETSTNA